MSTQTSRSNTQQKNASSDNQAQTLEVVRFRLNHGAETEAFIEASKAVNQFLKDQTGFLYRSLCQEGDQWLDVIYWANMTNAETAAKKLCQTADVKPFMSMIEEASVVIEHADIHQSTCMVDEDSSENKAA